MMGITVTRGAGGAGYTWLSFAYATAASGADYDFAAYGNPLASWTVESFKFYYGTGAGWMGGAKTGLDAFGFANDAKTGLIEYAVRTNYKTARSPYEFSKLTAGQRNFRTAQTLGKTGANYLKIFKGLGVAGNVVTTGLSGYNAYHQIKDEGWSSAFVNHRDGLDAAVGAVGIGAGILAGVGIISNPVGWGIGIGVGVYMLGTFVYDVVK
jgi:hypothetical protein